MSIFKQFSNFISKSASNIARAFVPLNTLDSTLINLLGNDYRFGVDSKDFLLKAYGMNPYVFMVIDRIVQRVVQIKKKLLSVKGEEIEDFNFNILANQLNNKENFDAILYRACATFLASGEVFIVKDQTLGENDKYFIPINYNVIINQDVKGEVISYRITHYGKSENYLPNEVKHILKPDITFDTNHGFSTLRAIRKVWESNNEVWSSEASLHKNKGISGILYSDGQRPMTPGEEEQLQNKYDSDNTGSNNFGKVKVSSAKLGYIPMGMNPNDLKSIESRIDHLRTICAAFNVDPKLFGDNEASTFNNLAEAQRAFIINAVIPLSEIILPELVSFISSSIFKSYTMQLDKDTILELNLTNEQKSARLGREVVQGILTPKQARNILYPDLVEEEGNLGASNNIPINDLLNLQQSVIEGRTSRDAAIAMLMSAYGFDEQTSNDILG